MRIGEHEVVVIDRDTLKVGCQRVKREELNKLLSELDTYPKGISVDEMEIGVPYVCVQTDMHGHFEGCVYVRGRNELVNLTDTTFRTKSESSMRFRPLGIHETLTLKGDRTCVLVNMK